ncbi:hypothetical protein CXF67_09740 [Psychroflexus sp. MES1-P1E]|nr:hypothetical protein CXF67_09740 [Psychroflexus sp. MES1-P1E]
MASLFSAFISLEVFSANFFRFCSKSNPILRFENRFLSSFFCSFFQSGSGESAQYFFPKTEPQSQSLVVVNKVYISLQFGIFNLYSAKFNPNSEAISLILE